MVRGKVEAAVCRPCVMSCVVRGCADSLLEMLEDVIELLNPEMFTTTDLLPNVLHALRMAVASLNDIQDAQMLVADIEKSVFKDAKLETVVKA